MTQPSCSCCPCRDVRGSAAHAIVAALADDDLDRAIEAGLPDCAPCAGCSDACTQALLAARDQRLRAWTARERYRARQVRLQRRAAERDSARAAAASPGTAATSAPAPALSSAAAAALARAKARAAERHKP